jgi:hypothetical protein
MARKVSNSLIFILILYLFLDMSSFMKLYSHMHLVQTIPHLHLMIDLFFFFQFFYSKTDFVPTVSIHDFSQPLFVSPSQTITSSPLIPPSHSITATHLPSVELIIFLN